MQDGFIKVAALTPQILVGDVQQNAKAILALARNTIAHHQAKILVFPELCLTGYTCSDLFLQDLLISAAEKHLAWLATQTKDIDALLAVGLPVRVQQKLYNCAALLHQGRILALVPKQHIPNYHEFYEARHFSPAPQDVTFIDFATQKIPFGTRVLITVPACKDLVIATEICEDLWVASPPSIEHTFAGATVILNLSASNELVGKPRYREDLVLGQSARLIAGYIYADAGWGESTQDLVFSGHNLIAENGHLLAASEPFADGVAISELDVNRIALERARMSTYKTLASAKGAGYLQVSCLLAAHTQFAVQQQLAVQSQPQPQPQSASSSELSASGSELSKPSATLTTLTRFVDRMPFVPDEQSTRERRCEDILNIQAHGLARRIEHTHAKHVIVGVSGGLDSTLALLVCVRAFELLNRDAIDIIAVTLPGFGTTGRTHNNATTLADILGVELREITISDAVRQHFLDIGHNERDHDVTYENCQARERTQILMDLANQEGGFVLGTGDLSELALGWATYNGDHMSMYAVNASIPKTLVRHLVRHVAKTCNNPEESSVLLDIVDTPVSPELLPASEDDTIVQKTEDLVGPYELHDFFLYQVIRAGFAPKKVFRLALYAWGDTYDKQTILKWLRIFYRRFFAQQFKRSCLPDGPKVGSVALSPRGDLRMPSDASSALWLAELEDL